MGRRGVDLEQGERMDAARRAKNQGELIFQFQQRMLYLWGWKKKIKDEDIKKHAGRGGLNRRVRSKTSSHSSGLSGVAWRLHVWRGSQLCESIACSLFVAPSAEGRTPGRAPSLASLNHVNATTSELLSAHSDRRYRNSCPQAFRASDLYRL